VVERHFHMVERQTQVAERRSGPFWLNFITVGVDCKMMDPFCSSAWLSGSALVSINVVTLRQSRLILVIVSLYSIVF